MRWRAITLDTSSENGRVVERRAVDRSSPSLRVFGYALRVLHRLKKCLCQILNHSLSLHTTKTAGLSHAREHGELYYGVA